MSVWFEDRVRLFISHTAAHKKIAAALSQSLVQYGISAFVAHEDVQPSQEWQDVIEEALRTCHALGALLTPDFPQSSWTDQEVGAAFLRGALIVPVRLGIDPYGFVAKFQGLEGQNKPSDALAEEIFKVIVNHQSTRAHAAHALVSVFEESTSWKEAKDNMCLLEEIAYLNDPLKSRLQAATQSTSQISNAWGVPERIQSLIASFA